ncbi:MAG: hypothetical protein LBL66_07445 [Clostridiales bacterium]|nr:hypothetical protein [Clostridiales bacterium]
MYKPRCYGVIARSAERATRQSLYKKVRFVFGRDCRFALLAMTGSNAICTLPGSGKTVYKRR